MKKKTAWVEPDYPYHDYERGAESVYVNGLSDVVTAIEALNQNIILLGQLIERHFSKK